MRWRIFAGVVLTGIALGAPPASVMGAAPVYNIAASEACLKSLHGSVGGLPPASPPVPPALFVYRYPPTHFSAPAVGRLGVWYGRKPTSAYASASLEFFKDAQAARRFKARANLYATNLFRNVAVAWYPGSAPTEAWQSAVQRCLRAVGGKFPPGRAAPKASLATFVGYWGGHTRALRITSAGRGREFADDGCCRRFYDMKFQILSVTGRLTNASASYRVTSYRFNRRTGPPVHVGQTGNLRLKNGIVTSSLTHDFFCSNPAWLATGACGA
jgi:hypothetical protein